MDEAIETVAELTVYYKRQPLTRLIFDNPETADKVVELLTMLFNEKGKREISFGREIKKVYSPKTLIFELFDYIEGEIHPKGTLLDVMKAIDGYN